jgi:hypothetical protein
MRVVDALRVQHCGDPIGERRGHAQHRNIGRARWVAEPRGDLGAAGLQVRLPALGLERDERVGVARHRDTNGIHTLLECRERRQQSTAGASGGGWLGLLCFLKKEAARSERCEAGCGVIRHQSLNGARGRRHGAWNLALLTVKR